MTAFRPLGPHYGTAQQQTLVAATAAPFTISGSDNQLRVWNSGSNTLYFCTYSSAGTARIASATDCFVPANVVTTITKPEGHDKVSFLSPSGTTVEFMTGEGW